MQSLPALGQEQWCRRNFEVSLAHESTRVLDVERTTTTELAWDAHFYVQSSKTTGTEASFNRISKSIQ